MWICWYFVFGVAFALSPALPPLFSFTPPSSYERLVQSGYRERFAAVLGCWLVRFDLTFSIFIFTGDNEDQIRLLQGKKGDAMKLPKKGRIEIVCARSSACR